MSSNDMLTTADSQKWEEAQKRAFTHWVNSMLKRRDIHIDNIMEAFVNGVNLINLVEILTGKPVNQRWTKTPTLRVHKINNCFIGIGHLKEAGVKNLTVSAEDFVDGDKVNLVLGFCWQLLRHFQEPPPSGDGEDGFVSFEQGLLAWVKSMLKQYNDIDLSRGFKSESFQNGKVILGLINEYGEGLVDYKSYKGDRHSWLDNCKSGLEIAEEKMGIPAIIEAEDLSGGHCSEKQLVLYLSLMYNAYKEKNLGMTTESLLKRVKELEEKLRQLQEENAHLKEALKNIDLTHANLQTNYKDTSDQNRKLVTKREELSSQLSTLEEEYEKARLKWEEELARLRAEKAKLAANSDSSVTSLNAQWDEIQASRDKIREEFRKAKEELTKQKEELDSENKKLVSKLERTAKTKDILEQLLSSQEASHNQTIAVLRKHTIQHVADTNVWVPILEIERNYNHTVVNMPKEGEVAKKNFEDQVEALSKIMTDENKSFGKLLKERELEEAEVLSVNMGKLKKRVKKDSEVPAPATKEKEKEPADKGKSPRSAPEKSKSPRTGQSGGSHHSKKSDRK